MQREKPPYTNRYRLPNKRTITIRNLIARETRINGAPPEDEYIAGMLAMRPERVAAHRAFIEREKEKPE